MGKVSGSGGKATVTVTYNNFSDDGEYYYNGTETSTGSVMSKTDYTSDLVVTDAAGAQCGKMDVSLHFSAAYSITNVFKGNNSPHLDTNTSGGTAVWQEYAADMTSLVQ